MIVALWALMGAPGLGFAQGVAGDITRPIAAAKRKALVKTAHTKIGFKPS